MVESTENRADLFAVGVADTATHGGEHPRIGLVLGPAQVALGHRLPGTDMLGLDHATASPSESAR